MRSLVFLELELASDKKNSENALLKFKPKALFLLEQVRTEAEWVCARYLKDLLVHFLLSRSSFSKMSHLHPTRQTRKGISNMKSRSSCLAFIYCSWMLLPEVSFKSLLSRRVVDAIIVFGFDKSAHMITVRSISFLFWKAESKGRRFRLPIS